MLRKIVVLLFVLLIPTLVMAAPIVGDIDFNKVKPKPNLGVIYINPSLVKITIEYPPNEAIPVVQIILSKMFGIREVRYLKDGVLYVWAEDENHRKITFFRVEVTPDETKRLTDELNGFINKLTSMGTLEGSMSQTEVKICSCGCNSPVTSCDKSCPYHERNA